MCLLVQQSSNFGKRGRNSVWMEKTSKWNHACRVNRRKRTHACCCREPVPPSCVALRFLSSVNFIEMQRWKMCSKRLLWGFFAGSWGQARVVGSSSRGSWGRCLHLAIPSAACHFKYSTWFFITRSSARTYKDTQLMFTVLAYLLPCSSQWHCG